MAPEDYLKYWRAEGPVFLGQVAPEHLYIAPALAPALERLLAFAQRNQALILVTGAPGTGKSSLLRWLFHGLPTATHEILLTAMVRKERGSGWLTPRLAELMGVATTEHTGQGEASLLRATAAKLDELIAEERKLVVAIDAAHLADGPDAWDELVAFLNLQSLAGTCLSFVLCGDLAAAQNLQAAPELRAKLAFRLALEPLAAAETVAYIKHRLALAGIDVPFDDEALAQIHAQTGGVIAQINAYAETCLVEACLTGARRITAAVAAAAAGRYAAPHAGGEVVPLKATGTAPAPAREQAMPPPPTGEARRAAHAEDGAAAIKLTSLFKHGDRRKP